MIIKSSSIRIFIFSLVIITCLSYGQNRLGHWEMIFHTKNTDDADAYIKLTNVSSQKWDEFKNVLSGTESVTLTIEGDYLGCYTPSPNFHCLDRGEPNYTPSIGYLKVKVECDNDGKSANFYFDATGQDFQGDKYITYNYDFDTFYYGGSCSSYGTTAITNGSTIYTDIDDGSGNLAFQPTNPTGLSVVAYNNHPRLTWTASLPSFSNIKYKVYRKPHLGSWAQIASNISSTNYIDYEINTSDAQKRTRYWYRVSAYTDKSSPGYSNEVFIYGYIDRMIEDVTDLTKIKDELTEQVNINSFTINGFPNPFNPIVTIQYSVPEKSAISIDIYNIEGRLIKTLIQREQNPGIYKINWDASDMPSGMYIAKLISTTGIELSEKILLSK